MSEPTLEMLEKNADALGKVIGGAVPDGIGFCLMIFSFGPEGWLTYSSNAERGSMLEALQELIDKVKEMPDNAESGRTDEAELQRGTGNGSDQEV